jgi:hypothetical protein
MIGAGQSYIYLGMSLPVLVWRDRAEALSCDTEAHAWKRIYSCRSSGTSGKSSIVGLLLFLPAPITSAAMNPSSAALLLLVDSVLIALGVYRPNVTVRPLLTKDLKLTQRATTRPLTPCSSGSALIPNRPFLGRCLILSVDFLPPSRCYVRYTFIKRFPLFTT